VDAARPSSHVPTGKAWLAGVTDSVTCQVAGGEVTVLFTLAPLHYTNTGPLVVPHQAAFDYAGSTVFGATTFSQLDAGDTFADYMLLHD
jgi:hypothetical protein